MIRTVEIVKEKGCAVRSLNMLIYNRITKQTVNQLYVFKICQISICYDLK